MNTLWLLETYENINALLKTRPKTIEYNTLKSVMTESEFEVVKLLKRRETLEKHRENKRLGLTRTNTKRKTTVDWKLIRDFVFGLSWVGR